MIKTPTVFILGAGASCDFNYPVGFKLVKKIIGLLSDNKTSLIMKLSRLNYAQNTIIQFKKALEYSGKYSIDAFLEHRTEFIDIGKICIYHVLSSCESHNALFTGDNWYRYIFNKLNTSFEDFSKNKVAFITFNYDRSLEHFLFTALKNSYNKTDKEIAEVLSHIPIIHVHGIIDRLPWQGAGGREYTKQFDEVLHYKKGVMKLKSFTKPSLSQKDFMKRMI